MRELDEKSDGNPDDRPGLAVLGSYPNSRLAHEAGLAVLAAGKHYWIHVSDGRYLLVVREESAADLKREVDISALRNRYWPPLPLELPVRTISKVPSVVAILFVVAMFSLQSSEPTVTELGINSSERVWERGEWWRIVTAFTLHADLSHLSGNILGLSLFGYLSCRYFGNGLAWSLIALSAAAANLTSVFTNLGQSYQSLGASTAVFAALGLITGFPIGNFIRAKEPILQRDWLIPFFGGCILFAWMGGGEFPTDVAAHLWSFGYGLVVATLGVLGGLHAKLKSRHQVFLLALTPAVLAGAWTWAYL